MQNNTNAQPSSSQKNDDDLKLDLSQIIEEEKTVDPGNEHKHQENFTTQSLPKDSGTTGPEPGEGENDEPDTSGEAG